MKYFLLIHTAGKKQALGLAQEKKLIDWLSFRHSPLRPPDPLVKIEKLLKRNQVKPHQLAGVIVNRGPGSFTSLRHAAAIANSFRLALGTKIAGVTNLTDPAKTPATAELKKELLTLCRLGLPRLKQKTRVLTPFYLRSPNITRPRENQPRTQRLK